VLEEAISPISIILAALVAGASIGLKDTTADAVKDDYQRLKMLILRRFKDDSDAQAQVEAAERALGADHTVLRERLQSAVADTDEELVRAARELLERVDPDGARAGKYQVTGTGGKVGAIAAHADEREAHLREVERYGRNLPEGSYGRRNREAIAARETRVATRLRAIEQAYRTATDRDVAIGAPEPASARRSPDRVVDKEIELG
jgi:hypothetical protein